MKIALVTDVWCPLVDRIVSTLQQLQRQLVALGHDVLVLHPGLLGGISGRSSLVERQLDHFNPDAIHLATEGRLGWRVRQYCIERGYAFSSSIHGRWPEHMKTRFHVPKRWSYAWLRFFHRASSAVLVPLNSVLHTLEQQGFQSLRAWTYAVDNNAYAFKEAPSMAPELGTLVHPVSLFVGQIAKHSNLEEFLSLDVPGSKVVCGDGPLAESLRSRYPSVRWLGAVSPQQLAQCYAVADVVVLPAIHSRFSLVMLEAMSCGVPVLVHPTQAAKEILGIPAVGGVAHHDLKTGWYQALAVPRHRARSRAQAFSWQYSVLMFLRHLVPKHSQAAVMVRPTLPKVVTKLSSKS